MTLGGGHAALVYTRYPLFVVGDSVSGTGVQCSNSWSFRQLSTQESQRVDDINTETAATTATTNRLLQTDAICAQCNITAAGEKRNLATKHRVYFSTHRHSGSVTIPNIARTLFGGDVTPEITPVLAMRRGRTLRPDKQNEEELCSDTQSLSTLALR